MLPACAKERRRIGLQELTVFIPVVPRGEEGERQVVAASPGQRKEGRCGGVKAAARRSRRAVLLLFVSGDIFH